jgi:hypothetical protein
LETVPSGLSLAERQYGKEGDRRHLRPTDQDLTVLFLSTDRTDDPIRQTALRRVLMASIGACYSLMANNRVSFSGSHLRSQS